MRLNLNDNIRVKLTEHGKDIYYHQYDRTNKLLGREVCKPSYPKVDEDGYTTFQLWCFIELYGIHMGMTLPNVIEPLDIVFDEPTIEQERKTDGDTISRQAAIGEVAKWMLEYGGEDEKRERVALGHVANGIKKLPSVQPERCEDCKNFSKTRLLIPQPERKKGKWVGAIEYCKHLEETTGERYQPSGLAGMIYCNQCWQASDRRSNYCRECGSYNWEEGDRT